MSFYYWSLGQAGMEELRSQVLYSYEVSVAIIILPQCSVCMIMLSRPYHHAILTIDIRWHHLFFFFF